MLFKCLLVSQKRSEDSHLFLKRKQVSKWQMISNCPFTISFRIIKQKWDTNYPKPPGCSVGNTYKLFLVLWLPAFIDNHVHSWAAPGHVWMHVALPVFPLNHAYLPFSPELSMIVIRWVSRDLPSPQSHPHDGVSDAHHHQGQHVDQNCHYDMVPAKVEKHITSIF